MAEHIPRSRLGRAIKAGVPIALVIAGAEFLDGRITIQRDHGQLIVTAEPMMRPVQDIARNVMRRARPCEPEKASAKLSRWQASITQPLFETVRVIRETIDAGVDIFSSVHSARSTPHFRFPR